MATKEIIIKDTHRALWYEDGVLARVLGAGRYELPRPRLFGRTPKVNKGGGRDHYGRAWTSVVFGGGVKGGQVIGATDAQGATVKERPVSAPDFMATVCRILGVDPNHCNQVGSRPVRVADKGATPIAELLS